MKKTVFYLLSAAALPVLFVSCGDDDEGGSYKASATVIETTSGDKLQVTRMGKNYYGYDDDGMLDYLAVSGDEYEVSGNGTKFSISDGDYEETIQLSYNGSGYISSMTCKETEDDDDDYSWSCSESASFSYDGSGHLTKISYSGSETEVYDGEKDSYSYSGSIALTWSDGVITKYVYSEKGSDGYTEVETYAFDYNDGQYPNTYNQYTPSLLYMGGLLAFTFSYIGLNGIGPDYLPVTLTESYVYYEDDGYETSGGGTSSYKYSFNSDGTIYYQCTSNGKSYYYFDYEDFGSSSADGKAATVTTSSESLTPARTVHRGMFSKLANRRHQASASVAE